MKKKIAIIGSVGLPASYGGWETLVNFLTEELSADYDITVYCSGKKYDERLDSFNGARLEYVELDANGAQSIPYDIVSMWRARHHDTTLVLGVSGCMALPFFKLFTRPKYVVNPDGIEWRREKWGTLAKAVLKLSEAIAVKWGDVIVSDNVGIQDYIREAYGRESVFIPYGADHVEKTALKVRGTNPLGRPYAFKVARIEPENNVHTILAAFARQTKFDLVIIGNWANSEYGKRLKEDYSKYEHIHLFNPIYDSNELNKYRANAAIYVHGHSAGGTNPSLVEAMYLGLPILAKNVNYNVKTTDGAAIYFDDEESLVSAVETLDTERLADMASRLKQIAERDYVWSRVAQSYAQLF